MCPSFTLSPSADFPVLPVIRPTLLRQFLSGTRRASPVAQRVLATVLSLTPRWSDPPPQPACDEPCCLRPELKISASRIAPFRGYLCVHSRYGPVARSPSQRWLCQWASGHRFPSSLPFKLRGLWLLPRRDSSPSERVSLRWTHQLGGVLQCLYSISGIGTHENSPDVVALNSLVCFSRERLPWRRVRLLDRRGRGGGVSARGVLQCLRISSMSIRRSMG
jgi:hypothetical protein